MQKTSLFSILTLALLSCSACTSTKYVVERELEPESGKFMPTKQKLVVQSGVNVINKGLLSDEDSGSNTGLLGIFGSGSSGRSTQVDQEAVTQDGLGPTFKIKPDGTFVFNGSLDNVGTTAAMHRGIGKHLEEGRKALVRGLGIKTTGDIVDSNNAADVTKHQSDNAVRTTGITEPTRQLRETERTKRLGILTEAENAAP